MSQKESIYPLAYCDKFDAVLKGNATIESLCGQVDWADKFFVIQRSRLRDKAAGEKRSRFDAKEQAQDILYDQIDIEPDPEHVGKPLTTHGWGYRLQRGKHGHKPAPDSLKRAIVTPPNTRAKTRAGLVRQGYNVVEWDHVVVDGESYYLPDPLSDKVA